MPLFLVEQWPPFLQTHMCCAGEPQTQLGMGRDDTQALKPPGTQKSNFPFLQHCSSWEPVLFLKPQEG